MRRFPVRDAIVVLLVLLLATVAGAHDIPNARVDRSIQVGLEPGRLTIDYEVSLAELTLTQELRTLIGRLPGADRAAWFDRYGQETGPLNAKGILVTVDGRPVALRMAGFDLAVEEHPRYTFHFTSPLPANGRLEVQDTNFASSEGMSRLAVRGRGGVTVRGDDLPDDVEEIPWRPVWQLSDEEERRTKRVAVDFSGPAPEPTGRPSSAVARPGPPPSLRAKAPAGRAPARSPSRTPAWDRLSRLLDRSAGVSWLGLGALAFLLGVGHAVQPGHGKTLVAATALGERGGGLKAVALAVVTTAAHMGSVLLLAAALWATRTTRYESIHRGLAQAAGFAIAAIGLWRLGRHLAGFGEHEPPSDPDEESEASTLAAVSGSRSLLGLGLAGGLVPCWDAVVLIVVAHALGRLALGVALLMFFSLGMAAVLVAVGWTAARLQRRVLGRRDAGRAWERRLGIGSALVITVIGLALWVS